MISFILPAVVFGLLVADFYLIFVVAPEEAVQGLVQKIFYFHVSSAFAMYAGFLLSGLFALLFLIRRRTSHFCHCIAGATVGFVFCTMVLVSGPIWAYPIWGTWWTWDPRLTTYTILALIYVAYLMLRQGLEDPGRRARFAAVYGILGFISVPITFFSIRWWRTIHPVIIGSGDPTAQGTFDMTSPMMTG